MEWDKGGLLSFIAVATVGEGGGGGGGGAIVFYLYSHCFDVQRGVAQNQYGLCALISMKFCAWLGRASYRHGCAECGLR